jgi:hypothetical protein
MSETAGALADHEPRNQVPSEVLEDAGTLH